MQADLKFEEVNIPMNEVAAHEESERDGSPLKESFLDLSALHRSFVEESQVN